MYKIQAAITTLFLLNTNPCIASPVYGVDSFGHDGLITYTTTVKYNGPDGDTFPSLSDVIGVIASKIHNGQTYIHLPCYDAFIDGLSWSEATTIVANTCPSATFEVGPYDPGTTVETCIVSLNGYGDIGAWSEAASYSLTYFRNDSALLCSQSPPQPATSCNLHGPIMLDHGQHQLDGNSTSTHELDGELTIDCDHNTHGTVLLPEPITLGEGITSVLSLVEGQDISVEAGQKSLVLRSTISVVPGAAAGTFERSGVIIFNYQ
ncbi:TPA: hypothetical protein ACKFAD_002632 [Citrobacter koseri]